VGYKEDLEDFKKIFEDEKTEDERLKAIDKVNPFFFRDKVGDLIDLESDEDIKDHILVVRALKRMRPSWVVEYVNSGEWGRRVFDIAFANNVFDQKELYKHFYYDQGLGGDIRSKIFDSFTDQEIIKEIASKDDMHSLVAYEKLEEPLTEKEIEEIQDPLVLMQIIRSDTPEDPNHLIELLAAKSKDPKYKNLVEPALKYYEYDAGSNEESDRQTTWLLKQLGSFGVGADKTIIDMLPKNTIKNVFPNRSGYLSVELIPYVIDKIQDENFVKEIAMENVLDPERFRWVLPKLDDEDLRQMFVDIEDSGSVDYRANVKKALIPHMSPELLHRTLNYPENLLTDIATQALFHYLKKVSEPNQDLMEKLIHSNHKNLWRPAIKKFENKDKLKKMAEDPKKHEDLRKLVLERLSDLKADFTDTLKKIIDEGGRLGTMAFDLYVKQKDVDENFLKKAAEKGVAKAIDGINDKEFLRKLVLENKNNDITRKAYEKQAGDPPNLLDLLDEDNKHLKDWRKFAEKVVMEAKDEFIRRKALESWATTMLRDPGDKESKFAVKAIEKNPDIVNWLIRKEKHEDIKFTDDIAKIVNKLRVRSFDTPTQSEDQHTTTEEKVPSHKQQLLRLLLTYAKPAGVKHAT